MNPGLSDLLKQTALVFDVLRHSIPAALLYLI
jgi:hypothetical protein